MAITGKDGGVYLGANKIAELSSFSLDLGADEIDTTSFDSQNWKDFLAGLKEWSGSIEGNLKMDDANGQKALFQAWLSGTALAFDFKVNDAITFSGSAFIKLGIEVPVGDKATLSGDIRGTGPLTLPA